MTMNPTLTTPYDADTLMLRPTVLSLVADPAPKTRIAAFADWVWLLLRRCWRVKETGLALQLLSSFSAELEAAGPVDRLDVHLARLMNNATLSPAEQLRFGDQRVRLLIHLGDWTRATHQMAHLDRITVQPAERAHYANRMGVFLKERAEYSKAYPFFEQALTLARQTGNHDLEIRVLNNLGNWAFAQDDYATAIGYYEALLAHPAAPHFPRWQASAWGGLAMSWVDLHHYERVPTALNDAERLYGDYRSGVLRIWLNRTFYLVRVGQSMAAIEQGNAALKLAQTLGNPKRESFAHHNLGYAYAHAALWHNALYHLDCALTQRRKLGLPLLVTTTLKLITQLRPLLVAATPPPPDQDTLLRRLDALYTEGDERQVA